MLTLVDKTRERMAKLHNAIFNGCSTAIAVEINLKRTEFKDVTIHKDNYIKKYFLYYNYNTAKLFKDESSISISPTTFYFNSSFPEFLKEFEDEETVENKVKECMFSLQDFCGQVIGNNIHRDTDINVKFNNINNTYIINISSKVNLPMSQEQLTRYEGSISGLIIRRFDQTIEVDANIESILFIFPCTPSIPIMYTFDDKYFDIDSLFGEEKSYIDTSFDKAFKFFDNIHVNTKPTTIGLDKNFVKVNAILERIPKAKVQKLVNGLDEYNGNNNYRYEDDTIVGEFEYNTGVSVDYYLKGKNNNYLFYSLKENYNISPFTFFNTIKEYVDYSKGLDEDYRDKAKELFHIIHNDSYLFNRINIYPLSNLHIFKEDSYNFNTFHYYIKDEMHGLEKVFTIYNEDYILLREYPIKSSSPACYITLIKHKDDQTYAPILTSRIILEDDNMYRYLSWESVINGEKEYATKGIFKEAKSDELVESEVYQQFVYNAPELENLMLQNCMIDGHINTIVTKFDSILYNHNHLDDVIVRNYLGLPINYRYIYI